MKRCLSILLVLFAALTPASAQNAQKAEASGIAAKRPVLAGACHYCPWGAIAEVVKKAMQPYGYDAQICYICAGQFGPRQVADKLVPTRPEPVPGAAPRPEGLVIMGPREPLPTAPVDFGATSTINFRRAYDGTHDYAKDKEGPRKNLRVFAVVTYPNYVLVAATKESGITDLAQLKGRKAPLRVLVDNNFAPQVLAHYGHTEASVTAAGGTWRRGGPQTDKDFDLVIFGGTLSNAPEQAVWYTITQKQVLVFLQMPEALIAEFDKAADYVRVTAPLGLLRGLDRNIPTVARHGNVVFGRADAPDDFAYAVAKALDEQQDLWTWAPIPLYYNPRNAWKADGLPLHPGAERYYREKGYMK